MLKTINPENSLETLITLGKFKSDKEYQLESLKNNHNFTVFDQCFELTINKSNTSFNYGLTHKIIAISPYFILFFEKINKEGEANLLKLVNARSLIYLLSVSVKRFIDESLSNTLVLKWKKEELQILSFHDNCVSKFLEALSQTKSVPLIKNLKKTKYNKPISMKEVTSSAYKNTDHHALEASIDLLEKSLLNEKIDSENEEHRGKIQDLISLYRKVETKD